jgi:hypothetical protein
MEEDVSRISRRRLLKRLGLGSAVVALAPVVTSLGTEALAGTCPPCDGSPEGCSCDAFICGGALCQCGSGCGPIGDAYCSGDVEGNCFCWENSFCSEVTDCVSNADCPSGYACIPGTCCGTSKCLPMCGVGRRSRRRHGKLTNGKVR